MNRTTIITTLTFLALLQARGQEPSTSLRILKTDTQDRYFTGSVKVDLFASFSQDAAEEEMGSSIRSTLAEPMISFVRMRRIRLKSPWMAGMLSLALPGAGEFYSKSYWRGALFLAAEIAGWALAYAYDKKGDRQTDVFQDFADAHWSIVRYAQWIETYRTQLNATVTGCTGLVVNNNVDLATLNTCEAEIGLNTGNGFTHGLPRRPDQQYFELIGKYPQFAAGWDDGASITPADVIAGNVSPRFLEYSVLRGKANDFYTIASTAVSAVIVNHVLSALDAFLAAALQNKALRARARVRLRPSPLGAVTETIGTVSLDF